MSGIWLPFCALTISIFLLIVFFIKKNTNNSEVTIYSRMLTFNFLLCLNAVLVYVFAMKGFNINLIGIMQKIHLALLVLVINYFSIYVIMINRFSKKNNIILLFINFLISMFTILGIFMSPIEVIIFDEVLDNAGLSYKIALTGLFINFVQIVFFNIFFIINRNRSLKKSSPYIVLILFFIVGLLLRVYFHEVITDTYCVAFSLLTMFFTIENPDAKLVSELKELKEEAESASKAKTSFLSSMSHEIRTPLNAILGFSEVLEEENLSNTAKEEVKDIISASQGLLEIVNGILDISKIEANKLEIVNTNYNSEEVFNDLIKMTKSRLGDSKVDFRVSIDPKIPSVLYGDYVRLKQIITNILTNAVKYTKDGFISFKVSCATKNDICRLVISVEDTGIGIKKENIDTLFTEFERFDEEKNNGIEGTGLGMSITKKLVDLMNGKLVVESVYGEGSRFTVAINQKIISIKPINIDVKKEEKKEIDVANKRVLLVDDNILNIKVAARLLKQYNLEVDSATSGYECIDKINLGEKYDLILMDDMMPKMSGVETLNNLRVLDNFNTPTVVLTANAIEGMRDKYINNDHFDDYISKPIDREELDRVIRKFLVK